MSAHPVQLRVDRTEPMDRLHLVLRLALLCALGTLGCSSLYWMLYLAAPALVALYVSTKGSERYFGDAKTGLLPGLRWLAGAYAYLWLLSDDFPSSESGKTALTVELDGQPTMTSALGRLFNSLPALVVLAVLSMAAAILWIVGALSILARRRLPVTLDRFFTAVLRYQFRLIAYHLSLVRRYPSLEEQLPATPMAQPTAA
jgi:hypothetical protein